MIRFLCGFGLVWFGLFVWSYFDQPSAIWLPDDGYNGPLVAAELIGIPAVCAWFTLDLAQRFRPRRAFDPRARGRAIPILAGVAAATVSALLAAGAMALRANGLLGEYDEPLYEPAAIAVAAVLSTFLVAQLLRPAVRGHCIHCNYDLSGSPGGRCPECGAVGSIIEARRVRPRRTPDVVALGLMTLLLASLFLPRTQITALSAIRPFSFLSKYRAPQQANPPRAGDPYWLPL